MKRVLSFFALLLLPLSLMAMTPISDSDMSKVTGQAGVSIDIDMTLNISFAEMGWGDTDGVTPDLDGEIGGGWIGLDNLNITQMHIWPRTDFTMESNGTPDTLLADDGGWADLQFLTIDVVTFNDDAADAGLNNGPFYYQGQAGNVTNSAGDNVVTAVRIGIPTLTITMQSMTGNVVLGPALGSNSIGGVVNGAMYAGKDINTPDFNQLMGQFYVGGLNMAMGKDGAVLISAHGNGTLQGAGTNAGTDHILYGSGVTIDLQNVKIDYMLLDVAAWGDIDGSLDIVTSDADLGPGVARDTSGLTGAGWVGLNDLAIKNVMINGKVLIDVGTTLANAAPSTITDIHALGTLPDTGAYEAADEVAFLGIAECMEEIYNAAFGASGKTFVSIMLANGFTITMEEMGAQVALGSSIADLRAGNQVMGDIYVSGMNMGIYDNQLTETRSYVHIFAH